jgi:hypothetical protein
MDTDTETKPKRGRPRTQPLSKKEYNLQFYHQNKEILSQTNAKNTYKYRESFKILKRLIKDPSFSQLSDELKQDTLKLVDFTKHTSKMMFKDNKILINVTQDIHL